MILAGIEKPLWGFSMRLRVRIKILFTSISLHIHFTPRIFFQKMRGVFDRDCGSKTVDF